MCPSAIRPMLCTASLVRVPRIAVCSRGSEFDRSTAIFMRRSPTFLRRHQHRQHSNLAGNQPSSTSMTVAIRFLKVAQMILSPDGEALSAAECRRVRPPPHPLSALVSGSIAYWRPTDPHLVALW